MDAQWCMYACPCRVSYCFVSFYSSDDRTRCVLGLGIVASIEPLFIHTSPPNESPQRPTSVFFNTDAVVVVLVAVVESDDAAVALLLGLLS